MIDLSKYLGLPYDIHNELGVNCWGLYKMVKMDYQGLDVAAFSVINSSVRAISDRFESALKLDSHGHSMVSEPSDLDLVLLIKRTRKRAIYHCGVFIGGKILHAKGSGNTGQVWYQDLSEFTGWDLEYWRHE